MGFIFRSIFWLGLAVVILPPKERLGGTNTADFRDIDVALELHNAAYSLWAAGSQAASICETNPQLCKAGGDLLNASFATAKGLSARMASSFASVPEEALADAENASHPSKKIHARVE